MAEAGDSERATNSYTQTIHATAVAVDGRAVLITGASGAGKSALGLQLIALGADLIADDQCTLFERGMALWVQKPTSLPDLIEARGIGLLKARMAGPTAVHLVVDMDRISQDRLPPSHSVEYGGYLVDVLAKVDAPYFPSAIFTYLRHSLPDDSTHDSTS